MSISSATDLDRLSIDTIRTLSMDAVEQLQKIDQSKLFSICISMS